MGGRNKMESVWEELRNVLMEVTSSYMTDYIPVNSKCKIHIRFFINLFSFSSCKVNILLLLIRLLVTNLCQ
jgi:hypothetical protein